MKSSEPVISRREWLALSVGTGATLALTPALLGALERWSGKELIQRAIPSTGEMLPVIGVQFQNNTSQDPSALKEVLRTLIDNGGRFLDTMHQSVQGVEDLTARVVTELGVQSKLFLGLRLCPPARRNPAPTPRERRSRPCSRRSRCPRSICSSCRSKPIRRSSPF
jgi:hypothetical protein